MERPIYGLIGRGRVATHMAHYLQLEAQRFIRWHRGEDSSPEEALAEADVILLAISDDALEPFLLSHALDEERLTVHFSGSRALEGIPGLHPLMTFGPELYDLETYRSIPFIEEEGRPGFRDVFPALHNPSWPLKSTLKPLYHALCVLGGNFSTLLWAKAFADFEHRLGLPPELLLPYLRQVSANTAASGREAMTGSLARGDWETVRIDLKALEGDPFEVVFQAFIQVYENQEVTT